MPPTAVTSYRRRATTLIAGVALLGLAGCMGGGIGETTQHGYIITETALAQAPVGSSREQVLIALGTPSTTAEFGGEVFYYISQTRQRAVQFLDARITDQRIVAIYFNSNNRVERIADYGLEDGQIFDFVARTTPTGGADQTFIQQMFSGLLGG